MSSDPVSRTDFGPFLPLLVLAIALVISLGWTLGGLRAQYGAGLRIEGQQQQQLSQASAMENKLRQMMMELVVLAKQDSDAAGLVAKYGITFQPGPAPAAIPAAPAGTR